MDGVGWKLDKFCRLPIFSWFSNFCHSGNYLKSYAIHSDNGRSLPLIILYLILFKTLRQKFLWFFCINLGIEYVHCRVIISSVFSYHFSVGFSLSVYALTTEVRGKSVYYFRLKKVVYFREILIINATVEHTSTLSFINCRKCLNGQEFVLEL